MKRHEDEQRPILGIGGTASSDPDAWRPSNVLHPQNKNQRESQPRAGSSPQTVPADDSRSNDADAWRPSEAVKERLSALAPVRRRRKFALPRSIRFLASAVLFAIGMYAFVKLWTLPTETDLHPALAVFGAALLLLLIAAILSMVSRRRRVREDERSTLRL